MYSKETVNKMKRQPMEWEKISANHISDKGLIFKMHKEFTSKKKKNDQRTELDIFPKKTYKWPTGI